jgi:hypothetical protein
MITPLFSKSKPVNFVIVAAFTFFVFVFANYKAFNFEFVTISEQLLKAILTLLFILVLDFVIAKNNLTKKNSFGIMVLGLTFALFPETLKSTNILTANLLLLFALRRLLSLHTKQMLKKKFFDAAFWIALASLFYKWSILFLIVVVFALLFYWKDDIKNVAVACLGLLAVFILLLVYNVMFYDAYILKSNFQFETNLDISAYNSTAKLVAITILIAVYLWSSVFYMKSIKAKLQKMRPIHILVILYSVVALIIAAIAPQKNASAFLFMLAPYAIIVANYIETIDDRWFKEVFVTLLLITPIIALVL